MTYLCVKDGAMVQKKNLNFSCYNKGTGFFIDNGLQRDTKYKGIS